MNFLRALGYCLFTLGIYLGLPLLGWGLDDTTGFFAQPQRAGYALVVIAFGLAVGYQGLVVPEGVQGGKGKSDQFVRRQHVVAVVMVWVLFGALFILPFTARRGIGVIAIDPVVQWVMLALTGVGYLLVFWSGLALSRYYSIEVTLQEDHHLITSGLYRYIRHPRYLGVLLLSIAIPLLFRSVFGFILLPLMVALLLFRIQDEEYLLRQAFGHEWDNYCGHSWRLLPPIY